MDKITTKHQQAEYLARRHKEIEPGILAVYELLAEGLEDNSEEPVKLLEVNTATIPVGIQPIYFTPDPFHGLPFPTIIVAVAPQETDGLELPHSWTKGKRLA
jgi:hypothetical protein